MSICCKAIRQIYYNAGSGYTVASYMTNEDLPEEVKKTKEWKLWNISGIWKPNFRQTKAWMWN